MSPQLDPTVCAAGHTSISPLPDLLVYFYVKQMREQLVLVAAHSTREKPRCDGETRRCSFVIVDEYICQCKPNLKINIYNMLA